MKRAAVGSKFWSNGDQSKEVTVTSRRPNVAMSPRRYVATSRRQLEICTLSFKVRMVQKSGYRAAYERRHGIPEQSRVTQT